MGYRAKRDASNPDSYVPLDATLGMNGTYKYTNWGAKQDGTSQPAYNPSAIPPPLCLLSNYSEAQNGAGGYGNWPCSFSFVYICRMMGEWHACCMLDLLLLVCTAVAAACAPLC